MNCRGHPLLLGIALAKKRTSPPPSHAPIPKLTEQWLDRFDAGDAEAWWRLNRDLTLSAESDYYEDHLEFHGDLTSLPAWKNLDEAIRLRCVVAAERYLQTSDPHIDEWIGRNIFHRPTAAGYRALLLLYNLKPEALANLSSADWNRWAPVTISLSVNPSDDESRQAMEIAFLAYTQAPSSFIESLMIQLEKEKTSQPGHLFILRRLERCWDDRLINVLLQEMRGDSALLPQSLSDLFSHLLSRGGQPVLNEGYRYVSNRNAGVLEREQAIAVAVELLNKTPVDTWSTIWPTIRDDDDFGRIVITRLASHHEQSHEADFAAQLPEQAIAELYVWTFNRFPVRDDRDDEKIDSMNFFHNGLLSHLRKRGTSAAVAALHWIAGQLPKETWFSQIILSAERLRLRQTWVGLPPKALFDLIGNAHCRVIESPEQLQRAVLESLHRLEKKLHGETPARVFLWDKDVPKDEKALSDYVKLHLEDDLKALGVLAFREAEVRRGQEADIYIAAITREPMAGRIERIKLIIETKGCWNPGLKKAMGNQLKGKYLKDNSCGYGIYVVGWFNCQQWRDEGRKKKSPKWTVEKAKSFFDKQAVELSDASTHLLAFVLDAGLR